ncbi:hypothetical protein DL96DRAFT_1708890 [Flagelloscypha sp. PMI_526]|nr:hypothetical protein DL96DRAFT_1708890 [Flagelloscypha sp. PMI_526]
MDAFTSITAFLTTVTSSSIEEDSIMGFLVSSVSATTTSSSSEVPQDEERAGSFGHLFTTTAKATDLPKYNDSETYKTVPTQTFSRTSLTATTPLAPFIILMCPTQTIIRFNLPGALSTEIGL